MKLLLPFLLLSTCAQALNLPAINTANLPQIEAGRDYAVKNGLTTIPGFAFRISSGMPDACKGSVIDLYAHQRAGQILSGYPVVYVDKWMPPNSKLVRSALEVPNSDADILLWQNWEHQDSRKGIREDLWAPCQGWSNQLVSAFGIPVIRQLDNEPGNVQNSNIDPAVPYGVVPTLAKRQIEYQLANSTGVLCAPAWETENQEGLLNQIESENRRVWGRFTFQSLNWYLEPSTLWRTDDTPTKWAKRVHLAIAEFNKMYWWAGRPILITEIGHLTIPREKRLACYVAFLKNKPASIKLACWWTFSTDPNEAWGIQ